MAEQALAEAREALFQAQKLDAIGQLTGGVAHDFNNLLMAVLGSLELVRKRLPYDPRITPLLENAVRGAQRGAGLTQRMLAFARKQELRLEAVDLPALIFGMQGFVERTIGPMIRVNLRLPAGLPQVRTDPNQLESALLNLAVNARDAMADGGSLTITARACTVDGGMEGLQPGAYVCVAVIDSGEGMSEETLARATEPFFTTKGVGKGTGLGLSMVHGLTVQSGGALRLSSRVGEGTSVEIWLPVASAAEGLGAAAPQTAAEGDEGRRLTILAVDDDSLVLLNTAAMLEDYGHDVLQALSAKEALDIWGEAPRIDVVITDQAMPGMTGAQLADRLREMRPGLPVIIATGYAELPPGAGADTVRLAKPFTQEALAKAVAAAVEAHAVAPASP
jgi:CheY-like chemotaxis protein